jgi:hypothetical protein
MHVFIVRIDKRLYGFRLRADHWLAGIDDDMNALVITTEVELIIIVNVTEIEAEVVRLDTH